MSARAEVELDIFSGMPNPLWTLTAAEADDLLKRLNKLPPTSAKEMSGNLGYRGFIVQLFRGSRQTVLRIQNGVVQISEATTHRYVVDQGRALERWLLDTGLPHLAPEVAEIAERALH